MTEKQSKSIRNLTVLFAATAGISMGLSTVAFGQARLNTGGALDRNNRIGSGGDNGGGGVRLPSYVLNNNIVSGNVTGGRQFRGNVASTDPRAFRGSLSGGGFDRFIAQSAGSAPNVVQGNYFGEASSNAQAVRPYFGDSEGVAPPSGFIPLGASGGYVAPTALPSRIGSDLRLGNVYSNPTTALPKPGELLLPGAVDTSNNNTLISASPLYGVKGLNTGVASDVRFLSRYTSAGDDRRGVTYDDATVRRLQSELGQAEAEAPANPLGVGTPNAALNNSTDNTLNNDALKSDFATGQQSSGRVQLAPAVRQSAQYRELQARLDRFNTDSDPAAQANREYNEQVRLRNQQENQMKPPADPANPQGGENTRPGQGAPGAPPSGNPAAPGVNPADRTPATGIPGSTIPLPGRRAEKMERKIITSFAAGVQAKGLADVLTEAETLMRDQKFVSALDKYDLAEQIAPNNPLVLLGRANAELGASYYARAETHMRQAFTGAPALLMAKYDLRQFLGDERLTFLVKDLKEIANNEKAAARPLILLAYIAFNDGNDRMAAGYLDLAEKRLGKKDPFFDSVRKYWELPAYDSTSAEPNK